MWWCSWPLSFRPPLTATRSARTVGLTVRFSTSFIRPCHIVKARVYTGFLPCVIFESSGFMTSHRVILHCRRSAENHAIITNTE